MELSVWLLERLLMELHFLLVLLILFGHDFHRFINLILIGRICIHRQEVGDVGVNVRDAVAVFVFGGKSASRIVRTVIVSL